MEKLIIATNIDGLLLKHGAFFELYRNWFDRAIKKQATSNSKDYIYEILKVSRLGGFYDKIVASKTEKEPDKKELITELIEKHGNQNII